MPEQQTETVRIIGDISYKVGTRAQYNQQGSYDDKTLYWCTNTGELFKGIQPYGGGLRKIEDHTVLNAKAEQVIYLEPNGSGWAYEYATDQWTQVIYPITTVIDATSTDEQVPTAKAVYDALQKINVEDVDLSRYVTKEDIINTIRPIRYEISNKPDTALVDYREKEIRVLCPSNTAWALQNVGAGGDASQYYIGFKAYAPDDSVTNFKEDTAEIISDETLYSFEGNDFAGVDQYGRKYSIVWLPVASYNAEQDAWTYYGVNSSKEKYIGWYYSVEWYDASGKMVASDTIRINLCNEDCYESIQPFYLSGYASPNDLSTLQTSINQLEECCTWGTM